MSECARTPSWRNGGQPEKPAILVLSTADAALEHEVLAGIEEEGVPYLLERSAEQEAATTLAQRAANRSSLGVGVGIDSRGGVCILHEKLPEPLSGLNIASAASPGAARVAGHNAARMVVGIPLRIRES